MRVLSTVFALLFLAGVAAAQAPSSKAAQRRPPKAGAPGPSSRPEAKLAQLMRGILFPNSNIIFDTQTNDPSNAKQLGPAGGGTLATFANLYPAWEVVEDAALALTEAANLIMIPGRLCENDKPVPLQRPDFQKFAEGLREAGKAAYKAARSRNLDAVIEVTTPVAEACVNCHDVFRNGTPGSPARCVPKVVASLGGQAAPR